MGFFTILLCGALLLDFGYAAWYFSFMGCARGNGISSFNEFTKWCFLSHFLVICSISSAVYITRCRNNARITCIVGCIGHVLRIQGFSKPYAIIAGMAYQFFGGFYSNAEHPDIIRGYAFLPWLFAGFVTKNKLHATLLIPLFVYLMFSGAYMGQALALLWMGALFLFLIRAQIYRYFLVGIGLLLSIIIILPISLLKSEMVRSQAYSTIGHSFFTWKNFFTSFLWGYSDRLSQDLSMTTMYITLPIVGMLFLLSSQRIKENKAYLLFFLITALMITGSYFYDWVVRFIPPLSFSRFPTADYRAYFPIVMLYFSMLSLKDFREKKLITFI